jgi:hypothetical protein
MQIIQRRRTVEKSEVVTPRITNHQGSVKHVPANTNKLKAI